MQTTWRPTVALTMGDVAGIGPEVVARTCHDPRLKEWCRPLVVGNAECLKRAVELVGCDLRVHSIDSPSDIDPTSDALYCWNVGSPEASSVLPATVDAIAGRAAHDYLVAATRAALSSDIDAIATAPLNKEALRKSGLPYPGHTEILAATCRVNDFAMMLYLPSGELVKAQYGLGVVHTTLHTSIKSVPELLSTERIEEKICLIDQFMRTIGCPQPRIGVCALNPHSGENGLFGDEEARIIAPAVQATATEDRSVSGPLPADTLLRRAVAGEFDAVVAMYHDQGHIALKLIGFDRAINITLGLPIVRCSPSHGTAFDIAWQGKADATGMLEAVRIASLLAQQKHNELVANA